MSQKDGDRERDRERDRETEIESESEQVESLYNKEVWVYIQRIY